MDGGYLREHNAGVIARHDAYLTASPYDDDWDDLCEICGQPLDCECPECPECGEVGNPECYQGGECGGIGKPLPLKPGEYRLTPAQKRKLNRAQTTLYRLVQESLERRKANPVSIDGFFDAAPDGDFHWDNDDPGDPHVYCCGESDCPVQWHEAYYNMEMGREGGKRWAIVRTGDSDGNWDLSGGYDEREGDGPEEWTQFATWDMDNSDDYFRGWAEYWLECALSGEDPLNQSTRVKPGSLEWFQFAFDAAKGAIKYLRMR